MPGQPRFVDDAEWNAFTPSLRPALPPTAAAPDEHQAFLDRLELSKGGPFNLFRPGQPFVNGYPVGASSPATDTWLGSMATAPPGARLQGIRPQAEAAAGPPPPAAPTFEEARRNVGPEPANGWPSIEDVLGRTSNAMGEQFRVGPDDAMIRTELKNYLDVLPAKPGLVRPDPTLLKLGTKTMLSSLDKRNAAVKAEGDIEAEQKGALAENAAEAENLGRDAFIEENSFADSVAKQKREARAKMDADRKWLEENPTVDPYKTFRTNAGAGIMAAVGAALMATGAGLRRDSSLNWTQQISQMLDRETDLQMRAIQNKRANLNDQERNLKQIMESSADDYETRMRARNQKLFAINKRIDVIKNSTESKYVKERAKELMAQNEDAMGKNVADIAIRQMGIDSQLEQARLAAAGMGRGQDISVLQALMGAKYGADQTVTKARQAMLMPKITASDELKKLYGRADTTAELFFKALRDPKVKSAAKDDAARAFSGALQALLEGTDKGGDRPAVAAYSWPTDWKELVARLDRYDPQTIAELRLMMKQLYRDRNDFIWGKALDPYSTPNSEYSQPPPGR